MRHRDEIKAMYKVIREQELELIEKEDKIDDLLQRLDRLAVAIQKLALGNMQTQKK